jgi:hypothetical protein
MGAFGHHHNNTHKMAHAQESIGKRRRTRLSKNPVNRRRDSGAVSEIWWVFLVFRVLGPQLCYYRELPAATTTIDRKLYMHSRVLERGGKQDCLKILLIGEEMVEL